MKYIPSVLKSQFHDILAYHRRTQVIKNPYIIIQKFNNDRYIAILNYSFSNPE